MDYLPEYATAMGLLDHVEEMMNRLYIAILHNDGKLIEPITIEHRESDLSVTLGPNAERDEMVLKVRPLSNRVSYPSEKQTLHLSGDLARNSLVLAAALAAVLYDL